MKNENQKQSAELINKLILLLITVSIVICIFLYIFGRFHFNIIFAAITSIMTIVHLGLLIYTKKLHYCDKFNKITSSGKSSTGVGKNIVPQSNS